MINDTIHTIWPGWKVVDKIGNDSRDMLFEVIQSNDSADTRGSVKVISIPEEEAEIHTLLAKGKSDEWIQTYLKKKTSDYIRRIQFIAAFRGASNMIRIEDCRAVEKTDQTGWEIYIRMEFLYPLSVYTREHSMTEQEVVKMGINVCTALEQYEKCDTVHGNVKAEQIFIDASGKYKLGDFGKSWEKENTVTGYGQKNDKIEKTEDVYALGKMISELLNGKQISGNLAQVLFYSCSSDSGKRFRSVTAMKNALKSISYTAENISEKRSNQEVRKDINNGKTEHTVPGGENIPPVVRKKDKRKQILASTILVILLIAAFMFGRILLFTIPNLMDEKEKNDSEKSAAVVEKEEDSEQNQQEDDDKKTKITEALKEAEAQKQVNAVKESGFDARMFVTTDWSNLNSEKCT